MLDGYVKLPFRSPLQRTDLVLTLPTAKNLVKGWRELVHIQQQATHKIAQMQKQYSRPEFSLQYFNTLWEDEKQARRRSASEATGIGYEAGLADAQLWTLALDYLVAKREWSALSPSISTTQGLDHMQTQPQEWTTFARMCAASQQLQATQDRLLAHLSEHRREASFDNDSRLANWISSPEGTRAGRFWRRHKYDKALDALELACINRFQEAERCSRPGTNYKLRQKIAAALRDRARGIDAAHKRYVDAWNDLPLEGKPPLLKRESLGEGQDSVSDHFTSARDGMSSYSHEDWAQPVAREGIRHARLHECAIMEQKQLGIELSRLLLWMDQAPQALCSQIDSAALPLPISALWGNAQPDELDAYPSAITPMLAVLYQQEKLEALQRVISDGRKTLTKLDIPATDHLRLEPSPTFPFVRPDRRLLCWRNENRIGMCVEEVGGGKARLNFPEEGIDPLVDAQLPGLTETADDLLELP